VGDSSGPSKAARGAAAAAQSVVAPTQFALLKLARIVLELLPDGPSEARVQLRGIMGQLRAELGQHRTQANATDVAWEVEDEQEL